MVDKKMLKEYAEKLMFDMSEQEYQILEEEFKVIIKQMDKIAKIENIKSVEPMTFPFELETLSLREDVIGDYLTVEEVLANTNHQVNNQIKVPKVVE